MALLDDLQKIGYGDSIAKAITGYYGALRDKIIRERSQDVIDQTLKDLQFDKEGNVISGDRTNLSMIDPINLATKKSIASLMLGKIAPDNKYIDLVGNVYNDLSNAVGQESALNMMKTNMEEVKSRAEYLKNQADWMKFLREQESSPSGSPLSASSGLPDETLYHFTERMKYDSPLLNSVLGLKNKVEKTGELTDKDLLQAYTEVVKSTPLGITPISPEEFATNVRGLFSTYKTGQVNKPADPLVEEMRKIEESRKGNANKDASGAPATSPNPPQPSPAPDFGKSKSEAINRVFEDADINKYIDKTVSLESSGDPYSKSKTSSASGLGGFTDSTWLDLFKKYYPKEYKTYGENALAYKTDPTIARDLIGKYAMENANYFRENGIPVNQTNLRLAHFLGARGAKILINMAQEYPDMKVSEIPVVRQFVPMNKFMKDMTAQQLIDWASRSMEEK